MAYPVYKKVCRAEKFDARSARIVLHTCTKYFLRGTDHRAQIFLYSNHSVRKTFRESNPQSNTCKLENNCLQ